MGSKNRFHIDKSYTIILKKEIQTKSYKVNIDAPPAKVEKG